MLMAMFRRGRLHIVSPVRGHHRRYQAETPLIALFSFAEPALLSGFCSASFVRFGLLLLLWPCGARRQARKAVHKSTKLEVVASKRLTRQP
jgi:hypothetical protein